MYNNVSYTNTICFNFSVIANLSYSCNLIILTFKAYITCWWVISNKVKLITWICFQYLWVTNANNHLICCYKLCSLTDKYRNRAVCFISLNLCAKWVITKSVYITISCISYCVFVTKTYACNFIICFYVLFNDTHKLVILRSNNWICISDTKLSFGIITKHSHLSVCCKRTAVFITCAY